MKKLYFLLIALCLFSSVNAQIVTIPDANFKAKLLSANSGNTIAKDLLGNYFKIDANSDGNIQVTELLQVSALYVSFSNIANISGIQNFTNLQTLDCTYNQLSSLNVSGLSNLIFLYCDNNQLTSVNLSGLNMLSRLSCSNNQLTSLDVSAIINLQHLKCNSNNLTNLIVNGLSSLLNLHVLIINCLV